MNREESKMKARMELALAGEKTEDGVDVPDSYLSRVKSHSEVQKAALKEEARTAVQSLPAWIKTQVEQLEMRRKARQRLEKPEFSPLAKTTPS